MTSENRNPDEHPRLDWHLDNWARYMREQDVEELECKIVDVYQSGSADFDTMCDHMERRCAITMEALVTDLPLPQRIAVHHFHLGAVWRMHRVRIEDVYLLARVRLSDGLRARGIS